MNIARASAGRLAGVKCEGHQDLVKSELKNGVDHNGNASETVIINCVVIVKLKGNKPVRFQLKIAKQVNKKGVVSLLKGFKAEQRVFIV